MHRRFRDAVHVDQPRRARRMILQPRPHPLWFKRFPAEHHGLELQLGAELGMRGVGGLQRVERRRGLAQNTDLLGNQQGVQILGRAHHRIGYHDHPAAVEQRPPDLPHREVERQRMALRPGQPRHVHVGVQGLQQTNHVAMRNRHALGRSRGAGGVDDVGDIIRARHRQRGAGIDRRVESGRSHR